MVFTATNVGSSHTYSQNNLAHLQSKKKKHQKNHSNDLHAPVHFVDVIPVGEEPRLVVEINVVVMGWNFQTNVSFSASLLAQNSHFQGGK
jgi:hypothetical protein